MLSVRAPSTFHRYECIPIDGVLTPRCGDAKVVKFYTQVSGATACIALKGHVPLVVSFQINHSNIVGLQHIVLPIHPKSSL